MNDTAAPPSPASGASLPRLLVVDDQPVNIQVLYQVFADTHQVFMATSGEQALKFCAANPPDLVLLDVSMPAMDGYEVCRRLKADPGTAAIPVIFVTASDDHDSEEMGLAAGAVDFIVKPVNPAIVRARVKTHLTLKHQADLLRNMAYVDGLTGVNNRRHFDERLDIEWRLSVRNSTSLSLIMLDVDFFKRYNDRYGHQMGDECLRQVASVLLGCTRRPADLAARYGGEEFVCLLPETNLDAAIAIARKLNEAVGARRIAHADSATAAVVTISLGVSCMVGQAGSTADQLLRGADAKLYLAKQNGRNRVEPPA
ncbi:MAG: diguanylate cyclase [Telluria sp.]